MKPYLAGFRFSVSRRRLLCKEGRKSSETESRYEPGACLRHHFGGAALPPAQNPSGQPDIGSAELNRRGMHSRRSELRHDWRGAAAHASRT